MISPGSTNYEVTEVGDYIFRTCFIDPYQGTMAAQFAKEQGYATAAVIFANDDDYSNGLYEAFKEAAQENGIEIVYEGQCNYEGHGLYGPGIPGGGFGSGYAVLSLLP